MTGWERETRRREKAFYFSTTTGTFFLLFKQRAPHFQLALGPENYVAGPVGNACSQEASFQNPVIRLWGSPSRMERACVGAPGNSLPQPSLGVSPAQPRHRNNASRGSLPTAPSFPTPPSIRSSSWAQPSRSRDKPSPQCPEFLTYRIHEQNKICCCFSLQG